MTDNERSQLIEDVLAAVISSLRTNAKTISQLTEVTNISDNDCFELSSGTRVRYSVLRDLISAMFADDQNSLMTLIAKNALNAVTFSVNGAKASLSVSQVGGRIVTTSMPIVTDANSGLISPLLKAKYDAAANNAGSALVIANSALEKARVNESTIGQLPDTVITIIDRNAVTTEDTVSVSFTKKNLTTGHVTTDQIDLIGADDMFAGIMTAQNYNDLVKAMADISAINEDVARLTTGITSLSSDSVVKFDGIKATLDDVSYEDPEDIGKVWWVEDAHTFYTVGEIDEQVTVIGLGSYPGRVLQCNGVLYRTELVPGDFQRRLVEYATVEALNALNVQLSVNVEQLEEQLESYATKSALETLSGQVVIGFDELREELEGFSAIGNAYNVTAARMQNGEPRQEGMGTTYYDTPQSAIDYVWSKEIAAIGMQITFALAENSWANWQYVGITIKEDDFCNQANWKDLAGMSAGGESVINVNELVGNADEYTLPSAIQALLNKETETGITYRKAGLIVTYLRDANNIKWETRQFLGTDPGDITLSSTADDSIWGYIGGAEAETVHTSDMPTDGGTDAFSTGGAYEHIIANFDEDVDQEGNRVYIPVNGAGNQIGSTRIVVPMSGGSGQGSNGVIMGVYAENSPLYAALGNVSTRLAIRSVTYDGGEVIPNSITHIEVRDTNSGMIIIDEEINVPCAATASDWNYTLELSGQYTTAGRQQLSITATDSQGNHKTIPLNVVVLDVTLSPRQDLTQVYQLERGRQVRPMFAYEKYGSDKGIRTYVELKRGDAWEEIAQLVVVNPYSQSVPIDPSALGLTHGSYQIRIHGEDVANPSVKSNTLYTSIMVTEADNMQPLVAMAYNDKANCEVKLYEQMSVNVAAYNPGANSTQVEVVMDGVVITTLTANNSSAYSVSKQVSGYLTDGTDSFEVGAYAEYGGNTISSGTITIRVVGSVIDAKLKDGADWVLDFAGRTNSEPDHTIADGDMVLSVNGSNWDSNGFGECLGERCLAIKENVQAVTNIAPIGAATVEDNGFAVQICFSTDNIVDPDAKLLECRDTSGAGFYIKGNAVGITAIGSPQKEYEERRFSCGEKITLTVVAEPTSMYVQRGSVRYSMLRLIINGEPCGVLPYTPGNLRNTQPIRMDGTHGDLNIFYMMGYTSYMEWAQAFDNYLAKLTDTDAMIKEYAFEDVCAMQEAEGTNEMRPQWRHLYDMGIPVAIVEGYPEDFARLDATDQTSEKMDAVVRYYYPEMPWRSVIISCRKRPQGTTSTKRPKHNKRFDKFTSVVLMYPDYDKEHIMSADELRDFNETKALAAMGYIRVGKNSIPTNIITVKVDYSDSTGANDSGVCDMINTVYRTLGSQDPDYLTPAQRAFNGTWTRGDVHLTGVEMNHSTANHPIAMFRYEKSHDPDKQVNLSEAYFEAKGNWKEDKSDQVALGFCKTPGYNLECLNYQDEDFVEVFAPRNVKVSDYINNVDTSEWDTSKVYLVSAYCGRNYRFMRHNGTTWQPTSGSMRQVDGRWVIEGDVLNPVTGFEMLTYEGMNWWRGVSSVDDMMAPIAANASSSWVTKLLSKISTDTVPAWTKYFECMIENDQLAIDYAMGKKLPFDLYVGLRFCDRAAEDAHPTDWESVWYNHFCKVFNPKSAAVWAADCDYNTEFDSVSKNNQPTMHLEDGHSVVDGVYDPEEADADSLTGFNYEFVLGADQPIKTYHNKKYDVDGANGEDNDGSCEADPETDTFEVSPSNPYAGYNSVVFQNIARHPQMLLTSGEEINYRNIVAGMRGLQITLEDGATLQPFSPAGAKHYFCKMRTRRWPKKVSASDGIRKYEKYTATSDQLYFYAQQGLRLTDMPRFIDERWRYRDGYYGCADFYTGILSGRIATTDPNATITIKAAKSGYFGIGNDAPGSTTERVYLQANEVHTFTNFTHENGALLYIYQADRISEIDLSGFELSNGFDFSVMKLARKIVVGGENYQPGGLTYPKLTSIAPGSLPFLTHLDIRNTQITSVIASSCPRLETLLAAGSQLATLEIAKTAPVSVLQLSPYISNLKLNDLPMLTYPGGLTAEGLSNVAEFQFSACPGVSVATLLRNIVDSQTAPGALRRVGVTSDTPIIGNGSELLAMIDRRVGGFDNVRPIVNAEYRLTTILEQQELDTIETGIDRIRLVTGIDAFVGTMNEVLGGDCGSEIEVGNITLDNIGDHIIYFNGETFAQSLVRISRSEMAINDYINLPNPYQYE